MEKLRKQLIKETEKKVAESFDNEILLMQCSRLIAEIDKAISTMKSRLKEWYSYYNHKVEDVLDLPKGKSSLGAEFGKEDLKIIQDNIKEVKILMKAKENNIKYLKTLMKDKVPRLLDVAGPEIGAKLIDHANGVKQLASMASSKIQVLGAEKALFRHLREGFKAPKYGIIYLHQKVQKAENKGKVARKLSSEISKAVRIDYFRK